MADIVVIEDSYEISRLIQLALGAKGHKVTTYHDGLDGLEGVVARPPQLVISDVNLPGMNGFEVVKNIRQRLAGRPLGIMMLTSRTDLDSRVEGLSHADDYLGKPFELRELGARVDALLRRYAGASSPSSASSSVSLTLERPLQAGLSGALEAIGGAMAALQMVSVTQSAGGLVFEGVGTVYLRDGKVVHAERPFQEGSEAAYALLALDQGQFSFDPTLKPELETMSAEPMMLMLDVSRVKDEQAQAQQVLVNTEQAAADDENDLLIFDDILEPIDLQSSGAIVVPSILAAQTLLEGTSLRVEERQDTASGSVCLVFEGKGLRLAVLNVTMADYSGV